MRRTGRITAVIVAGLAALALSGIATAKDKKPDGRALYNPHHGGAKVLEEITPEMLKLMKKFAVDHAADSEHPMTCG